MHAGSSHETDSMSPDTSSGSTVIGAPSAPCGTAGGQELAASTVIIPVIAGAWGWQTYGLEPGTVNVC